MQECKISIIIPVYNVENTLNRCIENVINQEYKNLEIILVDDGSPDNCPQICDDWASKESRIKVIHKQNGGLSDARNTGFEIASGSYITFLDSDDYFLDNFSKACNIVTQHQDLDVISFGKGVDIFENLNYPISACMKFFKIEFLKKYKIQFIKGIYHEDVPFSLEILINTNKILCVNYNFYYYDKSSTTSITREKNEEKFYKRFNDVYKSIDIINKKYNNILNEKRFVKYLSRTRFDSLKLCKYIKNKTYKDNIIKTLKKNKQYLKYPKTLQDRLIKISLTLIGCKNTVKFISKL